MFNHKTDVVIIGAGPVGIFTIFQLGMLKINSHIIDSLEYAGGQCSALYPEKPIYDIPACPKISAQDLIDNLLKQASPFNAQFHLNQKVISLTKKSDNSFDVKTSTNNVINCKVVIIAAGCGSFGANKPPINNIEEYEDKSVFYSVKSIDNFRGKKVVIAGGGDSAVDWALNLVGVAKEINVIHRRNKFRCAPDSQAKLENYEREGLINILVPYQLHDIEGINGYVNKIIVENFKGGKKEIEADCLLAFFGLAMDLGPIADWGLNLDKNHIQVNPINMQTSNEAIYAVGDIATYENKLKLILTGFSEAAIAAHEIYKIIYPDKVFHFEYSTSKGIDN